MATDGAKALIHSDQSELEKEDYTVNGCVELYSVVFFSSYTTAKSERESFPVTPCDTNEAQVFEPQRGTQPLIYQKGDDLNKSQSDDKVIKLQNSDGIRCKMII